MTILQMALALVAGGVLTAPDAVDLAKAGPRPEDYASAVHRWLGDNLKDADSAKIEETRGPRIGVHFYKGPMFSTRHGPEAWFVCYRVNAKNSYGGYTGWETYMFAFQNGHILGALSTGRSKFDDKPILEECEMPPT